MNTAIALPQMIRVTDFGALNGMTRAQAYAAVDKMPAGVKIKIGGRLRLNVDRLRAYLEAGGDFARQSA